MHPGGGFTLTVFDGTTDGCVTYSPLTCCCSILDRDTDQEDLPRVVKALYRYREAANTYFAS